MKDSYHLDQNLEFTVYEISGFSTPVLISAWNKEYFFIFSEEEIQKLMHFENVVLEKNI